MSPLKPHKKIISTPIKSLCEKRKDLAAAFLEGKAPDFIWRHTRALDAYFQESYEKSAAGLKMSFEQKAFAIVALGGYGRGEQCIHSDIDMLLLFDRKVPGDAAELVREIIFPLWDIGFEVGHATRSIDACITIGREDVEALTALLDARFICGMSSLYSQMMDRLRREISRKGGETVIRRLIDRNRERHEQFGDSSYLLEPNLKEGSGGLRDYHTLLWIERVRNHLSQPRDLEYEGLFSHGEYRTLTDALEFIWQVRNRLHYISGRKTDHLQFRYQEQMAGEMGFAAEDGQQPVERFLGELHRHMEFLKTQLRIRIHELSVSKRRKNRKKIPAVKIAGLEMRKGMIGFQASRAIPKTPPLLMWIFEESLRLQVPLSIEARRLVGEFSHLIDAAFRNDPDMVRSFAGILTAPDEAISVLEAMLETGFLKCFIPDFDQVYHRIQYDEYHLYPVDKHLLRTVRMIKQFGTPDDPTGKGLCGQLFNEIPRPDLLLWAGLLHDIGKGTSAGNHSEKGAEMVRVLMTEKGYPPEDAETVSFLVREHLFLVKIATRRDIQDEEVSIQCARKMEEADRLKMLYLLTVADSLATGPKAWNDWTAALLETLFLNILNTLKSGELGTRQAMRHVEEKKNLLLNAVGEASDKTKLEKLLFYMSPRYLLYIPADEMQRHIALSEALEDRRFIWKIERVSGSDTRRVTVCARDCPGLFSRIAGTFTLNGINILSAQIYTWRNNMALDIFEVTPPPDQIFEDEKWEQAASDLESALMGTLNLGKAIQEKAANYKTPRPSVSAKPDRVVVDNESSSFFTIIEVFTEDVPGLLFNVTDTLFRCHLDIWVSKIATKVDQAVDVFYVRDFDGQKIDGPGQGEIIESEILKTLGRKGEPVETEPHPC